MRIKLAPVTAAAIIVTATASHPAPIPAASGRGDAAVILDARSEDVSTKMEVNRRTIDQDDTKLAVRSPGKIAFPDLSEVGGIFRDTKIQRKAKKLLEGSHEPGLVLHTHTIPYAHAHPMITPAELSMYKLDNMVNHMKSGVGFS